jgi:glycosyltransferase involved in cell wall biosynthesis
VFSRSLKSAEKVITISNTVRSEILSAFTLAESKVIAIHLGVKNSWDAAGDADAVLQKYKIPKPYLLAVGTIEPRKNIKMLLQAFHQLKQRHSLSHKLVVTGKQGWDPLSFGKADLNDFIQNSGEVIFTGYVSEAELSALYSASELFLFPSLYEGFGLPLLEAFAAGTPVMASDIPVHREICTDAAYFAQPDDIGQWVRSLHDLIRDSHRRQELVQKGFERLKKFSWRETARKTLAVYEMNQNR